ncbi:GNAT family N-acetyltransferase [Streptomyces sp. NPDC060194]|uniref:GNAT family N-acetyltransferase n=1 Tax=Streptomyces sp. NPDC060194 TaxID=3347069 RepID=UPI00365DC198
MEHPTPRVGGKDEKLGQRLDEELTAFNNRATGADPEEFSVRVDAPDGELLGGLTGWIWGDACFVDMLWVREDQRGTGLGRDLIAAAEAEALRRGCDRVLVSSFTFQAPAFYQRLGYVETGRTLGIPGGHADVHMAKRLDGADTAQWVRAELA